MKKRKVVYLMMLVVMLFGILLFLFNCGGAGNDLVQEYIKVIGTAKMLIKSLETKDIYSDPTTANAIMPSWYYKGAWQFGDIVTVGSDGHFSVSLPADSDRCVILLVDTTQQQKIDQIVGYVAIGVDAEHNLLNFPASEAKGDIDLGTIDQDADNPDEVKSDESNVSSVTANLNLTLDELKQMASNDKLLKSIKNEYANTNGDDWHGLNPTYMYTYNNCLQSYDWSNFLTPDIIFDPDNSSNLEKEYTILYMTTVAADDPQKSEFGNSELSLYLPDGTYTIDAQDQDGNTGISIPAGARLSTDKSLNYPAELQPYDFWDESGLGFFHGIVPDGQWILKKDGVEIARYDLTTGDPFDSNNNILVFVPALKLNLTGSIVNSIDISWYLYDKATGIYQEVESTSKGFTDVVSYLQVSLNYYGDDTISEYFETGGEGGTVGGNLSITDTHITPVNYTWTISSTPANGETQLTSLSITYEVYGTRFSFDYR